MSIAEVNNAYDQGRAASILSYSAQRATQWRCVCVLCQVVDRYQALPVYGVREVPSQNHQKANYEVAQVRNPLQVDSHFANKKKAASSARP
jgi:hypothetical protein